MFLIFIILYRDSVIGTLRTICALQGFALAARPSGKFKAIIQALCALAIILLLIPYSLGHLSQFALHFFSTILASIASLYTLFSGFEYIYFYRHHIARILLTKKSKETQKELTETTSSY